MYAVIHILKHLFWYTNYVLKLKISTYAVYELSCSGLYTRSCFTYYMFKYVVLVKRHSCF
jgi:hypothetical protein